jgi:two-component system sensor histidine kinase KdpD
MNSRRVIAAIRWVLSFLLLGGIVLIYRRWLHVNPTTVALTLLLCILAIASSWSLRLAVLLSVFATLCYNLFFLPPFGTLTIADPQNWIALLAFLSTAVIGSRLSQRARDEAADAKRRQYELEILFRLSRELLQTENVAELASIIPGVVVAATVSRSSLLYLLQNDRVYRAGAESSSPIELHYLREQAESLRATTSTDGSLLIPLRSGIRPRGLLLIDGASLSNETADAMSGVISVLLDRAQALEEVAHNKANAESERLRTLLIDSITHELRTPLTSIKGAATTLIGDPSINPQMQHELLTIIDEESDRIDRLIQQATEMSQLDTQKVQMHLESLSVNDLVEDALASSAWIRNEHPITVEIAGSDTVRADREYLKKVLCNLLENAAKYSPAGAPIKISSEQTATGVAISVADQGIGIDPSDQALIFDRFYRAPVHSQRVPGTGMGLSISRAIIEKHGGRLSLVSQPGRGSVFTVLVPQEQVASAR